MMSVENRRQAFGLWHGARKPIENKTVRAVQPEPVFNQFHDRCIRDQSALLNYLGRLRPQRCPEIFLSSQNCARRSDWNSKLARNQFSLGTFPRTGCAEQNKPFLHSAAVKKNRDPTDDQNRSEEHTSELQSRFD